MYVRTDMGRVPTKERRCGEMWVGSRRGGVGTGVGEETAGGRRYGAVQMTSIARVCVCANLARRHLPSASTAGFAAWRAGTRHARTRRHNGMRVLRADMAIGAVCCLRGDIWRRVGVYARAGNKEGGTMR
jgi:hypothetical protein